MSPLNRRTVLGAGVLGIGLGAMINSGTAAARDRVSRIGIRRAIRSAGTTLEQAASPAGASGYRRLMAGPGYPLVVRDDLVTGRSDRDDRRQALASVVQITDLHMIDAQSPMRFEFLHQLTGSAFRPQEALGTQGAVQLVRRINELARGPFSGRDFDCVVSTGDNTDNHEDIELDWFLTVLNGGTITPSTGDPERWEGVQTGGDDFYFQPEDDLDDLYKQAGFPVLEGFFGRATAAHESPGLQTPWFSVFGNHDDSISGTLPSNFAFLDEVYTGSIKFTGFADDRAQAELRATVRSDGRRTARAAANTERRPMIMEERPKLRTGWRVTPDARRRTFSPQEFIARHLYADHVGPGPVGHGFDEEAAGTGRGYYTFEISDRVTGVALDSTNRAGFTEGSIGHRQWQWLKDVLDSDDERYFVIFSHHTSDSMTNLLLDPAAPWDIRHSGSQLLDLLHDHPGVLAWVNGHSHVNKLTPHPDDDPRRSFWEINTASHVDFPQHARVIDICDNADGTLSLFTTLIESAAPYEASYSADDPAALASLYRELSFNDIHAEPEAEGKAADRNTELLITDPYA